MSPRAALLVAFGLGASACATGSTGYRARLAAGDRAYTAGRFREAAAAYEAAAGDAASPRDASDAAYRAGMACRRAGDLPCARRLLAAAGARRDDWGRAARARLELAALGLDSASESARAEARRALESLVVEAPDTGPARGALRLRLWALDADDPTRAAGAAWLAALATDPQVRRSALLESVLAERAVRVEAAGDLAAAERAWRTLVEAVPYPDNSHWDDGHLALARVQRAQGRAREAVATIDRMLAVQETSWGNGSYAAPRFDDGAYLRAEILRDDLRDPLAAAAAFHRVYVEHPTSLRRDDALWEEAALRSGADRAGACRVWATLVAEFPCRRFAARARDALAACPGSDRSVSCPARD